MSKRDPQQEARLRAELILKVRSGEITATQAAEQLGVSRKTYYKWEQRALAAMLEGLVERDPGRPLKETDPEVEQLKEKVRELEAEVERNAQRQTLRELLRDAEEKKE